MCIYRHIDLFTQMIVKEYGFLEAAAAAQAREILLDLPDRLFINIEEWSRGLPLTEIYIGPYCIDMILQLWENRDFLSAVRALGIFEKDPDKAERLIWNMRR